MTSSNRCEKPIAREDVDSQGHLFRVAVQASLGYLAEVFIEARPDDPLLTVVADRRPVVRAISHACACLSNRSRMARCFHGTIAERGISGDSSRPSGTVVGSDSGASGHVSGDTGKGR